VVRAVFIDRDGVINANVERDSRPVAPTRLEDFRLLPGVEEAISRLKAAHFKVIVITNQPDVATGRTERATVAAMHEEIMRRLDVDDIKVCTHVDSDNCECRKPKPGMLLEAAAEWGIDLAESYCIGDRWRDIEAGRAAGCLTLFVDYGVEQEAPMQPDRIIGSLTEAVAFILDHQQRGDRR
jgi:D-glycero-D-manno-heptose 1,7-bisphosphate phosphatase